MGFNVDDLRRAMKFLSVPLAEERLEVLVTVLDQTFRDLQPLTRIRLEKELEPTSYLARLRELEES